MKNNRKLIITGILFLIIIGSMTYTKLKKQKQEYKDTDLNVVLSLEDTITSNSIWCGTFNLIWNDLKTELVKKDIEFSPQLEIVKNLNKGTFTQNELKESSYVKTLGHPTYALKKEIETAIKNKFNETSDILDNFEWQDENDDDYFLYVMLKKDFSFPNEFTVLEKSNFKNTKNVSFFGIDDSTKEEVYKNVSILYYNSNHDFAIKLLTEEKEEVILSRGIEKNTLKEIYETIQNKSKEYTGTTSFSKGDTLKVPYLNLKIKKEFESLENKKFYLANGKEYFIGKALQTISLELNEKGGKIKSEAGMAVKNYSVMGTNVKKFHFDDDFVIFLKEQDKELPYFGATINDIEKFK